MAELAADSRSADSPPPPMPDDVLREILLRLPPDPIYLFRASSVSKHWRGLVHDAGFLRRCREFHGGTPPVLGFFNFTRPPLFVPKSGSFVVSAATMHHGDWWPLDCHRGRALLISRRSKALLVRDLVTGDERYLPLPPGFGGSWEWVRNCAALCAAGHADHCDCRSCPFLVAFIFSRSCFVTSACLYSSETGVWGKITSINTQGDQLVARKQMARVGNTLYCLLDNNLIIEFNLDTYSLDVIGKLSRDLLNSCSWHVVIMRAEDGGLGFAGGERFNLHLWSSVACTDGVVTCQHLRVIDLERFLVPEVVALCTAPVWAIGYAQDADVIFIEACPNAD
uniref:Uncharacterized protein n=3 Tax=Avena sativa TaxID=4498 RepID=A0ACD5X6H1_AVESA